MSADCKRILLVDDSNTDALLMREMLSASPRVPVEISWTECLRDCLERLAAETFDAILLDLSLPDSTGLNTIRKACAAAPTTPIIVVTGVTDEHVALEAVRCGAEDYLVKGETDARSVARAIGYAIDRKQAQQALRKARDELEQRVEERTAELTRANVELAQARDAAQAADRAKSAFLTHMSHEMRTPLNAIIGMTDLVLKDPLPAAHREYLSIVLESGQSLLAMIDDILNFSLVEAGRLTLAPEPFDLRERLESVMQPLAVRARRQGLALTWQVAPEVPRRMIGDHRRLRQVLTHLVGNGIKFTERGQVALEVAAEPSLAHEVALHFTIRDTGIGIPQERRAAIFEIFEQADTSLTRRHGGAGVGLSIASELVALMGGRIWMESEVGRGSCFHFTATFGKAPC